MNYQRKNLRFGGANLRFRVQFMEIRVKNEKTLSLYRDLEQRASIFAS